MIEMLVNKEINFDTVTKQYVVDKSKVEKLIELNKQKARMEAEYKSLSNDVKNQMELANVNTLLIDGHMVKLSPATRTTVKEEQLVDFLTESGRTYCLKTSIAPDIDRFRLEIGSSITREAFNYYVKETAYSKLTIK